MDKVIKFRAWDNRNKRIISWNELLNNKELLQSFFGNEYYATNPPRYFYERMQFTGLYDCAEKEVFEGDILEYKEYYANIKWWSSVEEIPIIAKRTEQQRQDFRVERNVVRFDNGSFCLGYTSLNKYYCCNNVLVEKLESGRQFHGDYERKQWDFKVIGNIYEHPNLLQ